MESESVGMEPGEQPVTRFRARLCETGREVTVRRFPRPNRKFRDAVDAVKKIWFVHSRSWRGFLFDAIASRHPNVVHAIGYSREDPEMAFIVNSGVCTSRRNA